MPPTPAMPVYGRQAATGLMPAGITDVLTIGEEATVFRPVQRALRPTGWAVAHVSSLDAAIAWLRSNVAAVAVIEAAVACNDWTSMVRSLRSLADAPEVVVVTWDNLPFEDVLGAGAFDVARRPFEHSDVLCTIATAWHNWMTRRERLAGGGLCSDA